MEIEQGVRDEMEYPFIGEGKGNISICHEIDLQRLCILCFVFILFLKVNLILMANLEICVSASKS